MKLLFDQNLSPKLVGMLATQYPGSSHVSLCGLDRAQDAAVWEYARQQGYILVTKDSDFEELSLLRGVPPMVVWLRLGNCTTGRIEEVLRQHADEIKAHAASGQTGCLVIHDR